MLTLCSGHSQSAFIKHVSYHVLLSLHGLMFWVLISRLLLARLDVRKYSFSNRVVDLWNSLPDSVISAETMSSFETRLDDYCKDQDILYKYESKINFKLQGNSQDEELVL